MCLSITRAIPLRTAESILAQFAMAGVELGQKYHGKDAIARFGGIAAELCGEVTCARFWDPPVNLQHPSAWRVIWDGITICNGATVLVILVCFTDHRGVIACELVIVWLSRTSEGCGPPRKKRKKGEQGVDVGSEPLNLLCSNIGGAEVPTVNVSPPREEGRADVQVNV